MRDVAASTRPTPAISVVIPLFETERFIGEALASVLAQTCDDFEVIVVDDGSSDRGPDIALACGDARVRVVSQANRGLAGARNTGIRESRGTFIAFLDADDRWHREKLARHVSALEQRPELGLSYSASRLIDDAGNALGLVQWPSRATTAPADVLCRNPIGNGSAPVLRRAALDAIAFWDAGLGRMCWFDESFRQSEDIECWTRLAATTNWQLALVPFILTEYRVSQAGLSANTTRQLETWRRFRRKVAGYASALEREHGDLAEAFQLRYLARRAVHSGDRTALDLMNAALKLAPSMCVWEPARTAVTYAAALARAYTPRSWTDTAISIVGEMMGAGARLAPR